MDEVQKRQIVERAWEYWNKGQPLKAGLLIFERIPLEYRPSWAADILEFAYRNLEPISEINTVIEFARMPEKWPLAKHREAHKVFDAVRNRSLQLPNAKKIDDLISTLAENTAGITYTSRQFQAPFDHNRGWYIVEGLHSLIEPLQLNQADAWAIVSNKDYLYLDVPISCHPGCPICHPPKWDYFDLGE